MAQQLLVSSGPFDPEFVCMLFEAYQAEIAVAEAQIREESAPAPMEAERATTLSPPPTK